MFEFKATTRIDRPIDAQGRLNSKGYLLHPDLWMQIQRTCNKQFTLDACCDVNGKNKLAQKWCAPGTFTTDACENNHV
jgi:hypothetical protein